LRIDGDSAAATLGASEREAGQMIVHGRQYVAEYADEAHPFGRINAIARSLRAIGRAAGRRRPAGAPRRSPLRRTRAC